MNRRIFILSELASSAISKLFSLTIQSSCSNTWRNSVEVRIMVILVPASYIACAHRYTSSKYSLEITSDPRTEDLHLCYSIAMLFSWHHWQLGLAYSVYTELREVRIFLSSSSSECQMVESCDPMHVWCCICTIIIEDCIMVVMDATGFWHAAQAMPWHHVFWVRQWSKCAGACKTLTTS